MVRLRPQIQQRTLRRRAKALIIAGAACVALLSASLRLQLGVFVGSRHLIAASTGIVGFFWYVGPSPRPNINGMVHSVGPFYAMPVHLSFQWWFYTPASKQTGGFGVPLWMPAAATLIPGVWLLRRSRNIRGHCRRCRYDLAGLPPGSRCPECGHAAPSSA